MRSGETRILPEQHEKVYFHWLENIEPWCIFAPALVGPPDTGLVRARTSTPVSSSMTRATARLDEVEIIRLLGQGLVKCGEIHHAGETFEEVRAKFEGDEAPLPAPLDHARRIEVENRAEAVHAFAEGPRGLQPLPEPRRPRLPDLA